MAAGAPPPNYYAILDVSEQAPAQQIRNAYKRAALKTHPDRVPTNSPERAERNRKFQLVNDAYYTLSNPDRRREYDSQRRNYRPRKASKTADPFTYAEEESSGQRPPGGMPDGFSWAWNHFTNQNSEERQQEEDAQFEDVFEEMMRDEDMAQEEGTNSPMGKFWSLVGSASGGALGFILANVPGMLAGAVAGNRLGAVRDAKGKSVFAVFQELPQADKARLLSQLAAKLFSHTVNPR